MLSINTNLSSLIAQNSMSSATKLLNQAVERMTTGYKINHAKDNAANYSITEKMNMQISSFDVAADNVAMGMDLVTTASDIISNMQDKASRLQALCTQARNGTYGAQSMQAINSEAAAIMAEINRLYNTAEYNNVSLFNNRAYEIADHLPQAGENGFIEQPVATFAMRAAATPSAPTAKAEYNGFIEDPVTYTDAEVAAMTKLSTVDVNQNLASGTYSISTVEELQKLAELANNGKLFDDFSDNPSNNYKFVLANDIDLSSISNWTPIEVPATNIHFTFDGNGHVIKNLTNDSADVNHGLFSEINEYSYIKNVALLDVNIKSESSVGALVSTANNSSVDNCYVTGVVSGGSAVGGLVGSAWDTRITNSYSMVAVSGASSVGGLVGRVNYYVGISNCYATGNVTGTADNVGGLVGNAADQSYIADSYATGDVTGQNNVGGLAGNGVSSITDSYATGAVNGTSYVGGLTGSNSSISNSYATGNVSGTSYVGGLAGSNSSISNSYAMGNVTGTADYVGGLLGYDNEVYINNSYATGTVSGASYVGGLAGSADYSANITNSYAAGNVSGSAGYVGGLLGYAFSWDPDYGELVIRDSCSYSQSITGQDAVGSIVGAWVGEETNGYYTPITLTLENCSAISTISSVGGYCTYDADNNENFLDPNYDLGSYNLAVTQISTEPMQITLQVGIKSDSSNQISFDTKFALEFDSLTDLTSDEALASIMSFQTLLSDKATALGAVENRLQSAIESIEVNIENLTSSLSTIRDADIAEVSSEYIRQQILQQASATLLSTANQSPSIALQLI